MSTTVDRKGSNNPIFQQILPFLVFCAVLIVISVFVAIEGVEWFMPDQASVEAESIDNLFQFMLGIATFVFLLVECLVFYFVFRYGIMRNKADGEDGPPIHGNIQLEIFWTILPAIAVFAITVWSFDVLLDTTEPVDDEVEIGVTAQQFFWTFQYPDEQYELTANHMLVVPEGETIRLQMNTLDVIHAFWVPEFRVKQDVMPNRTTELRFTPSDPTGLPDSVELVTLEDLDIPGPDTACPVEEETPVTDAAVAEDAAEVETEGPTAMAEDVAESEDEGQQGAAEGGDQPPVVDEGGYPIVCAELCGANHGLMRGVVYVVSREEYDAYIESLRAQVIYAAAQQEYALRCGGAAIREAGVNLFNVYGCNTCHMLPDAGSTVMGQGPSLVNVGARALPDGYADHQEYIRASIVNPNEYIVEGYSPGIMPQNFASRMSPDELDILVAYLSLQVEE